MIRLHRSGFCFIITLICFSGPGLLAQDNGMRPPPVPQVMPEAPPDPDLLPPPPHIEWSAPGSRTQVAPGDVLQGPPAPSKETEPVVDPPPPPIIESLLDGEPDTEPGQAELEVWRDEAEYAQVPARLPNQLSQAYIAGTDAVLLHVQFGPQPDGTNVCVFPGKGVRIEPPDTVLPVSSAGTCNVSAKLDENFNESYIIFYCRGIETVLPVVRASLTRVQHEELSTGGGQ